MPLVTLIGEEIAIEGLEFTYLGPINDCKNCKLKTVCFNLKPGRKYKIISVRDKQHNCNVHEGPATVVEVKELPIITSINNDSSENSSIQLEKNDCNNIGCINYELCTVPLQKDKKYFVLKIFEEIDCPIGKKLVKAELTES